MNYLHSSFNAGNNNVVQVSLNEGWANIFLLDDLNFQNYKIGKKYKYYGGLAQISPFNIRPPYQNHWNLVIDKGGYTGTITATFKII